MSEQRRDEPDDLIINPNEAWPLGQQTDPLEQGEEWRKEEHRAMSEAFDEKSRMLADALAERDALKAENQTFRNAMKFCADCDGQTNEEYKQLKAENERLRDGNTAFLKQSLEFQTENERLQKELDEITTRLEDAIDEARGE